MDGSSGSGPNAAASRSMAAPTDGAADSRAASARSNRWAAPNAPSPPPACAEFEVLPEAEQQRQRRAGGGGGASGAAAAPTHGAGAGGTEPAATPSPSQDVGGARLEASLQSCTAHRDRILQMLVEEPENRHLIELRNELTNAVNQLHGWSLLRVTTGGPAMQTAWSDVADAPCGSVRPAPKYHAQMLGRVEFERRRLGREYSRLLRGLRRVADASPRAAAAAPASAASAGLLARTFWQEFGWLLGERHAASRDMAGSMSLAGHVLDGRG